MTVRQKDLNGFIEVKDNPLSKAGVFEYYGYEIDAPQPDKLYRVFRSPESLESAVDTFKGVPIVREHTMLGDGQVPAEKKGIEGVVGDNVYYKDGTIYGNLRLYTDRIKNLIESGKKELSFGYWSQYEFKKGVWQGKAYDAIQRIVGGNHLAILDGEGRMGETVAVLDHKPKFSQLTFTFDHKGIPMDDDKDVVPTEDIDDDSMSEETPEEQAIEDQTDAQQTATIQSLAADFASFKKEVMEKLSAMHGGSVATAEPTTDSEPDDKDEDEDDKKPTMDAKAIARKVEHDIRHKSELVNIVKPLVGTFDHSKMSAKDVAVYAAKKLGLTGDAESAVRAYAVATKKVKVATQDTAASTKPAKIQAGVYQ